MFKQNIGKIVLMLSFGGIFSGCASLSEGECLTGDWAGIGYRDGLQGLQQSELAEHQKACSEYKISLNLDEYLQGRTEGLKVYCLPSGAYRVGLNGDEYAYVCPKEFEAEFLISYQQGRKVYLQKQKVKSVQADINSADKQLKALDEKIKTTEKKLVSDGSSKHERKKLLSKLRDLEEETMKLKREAVHLEMELRVEESALMKLQ